MKRAFVIGHPIAHSRSPLIHGHWLKSYAIDGTYEAIDVAPATLPDFIARLRTGEFVGGNCTIPHKEAVFSLCDALSESADVIGAVNTLAMDGDRLLGDNTDWSGFLANLDEHAPGWSSNLGDVVVLGAGGAARGVLLALALRRPAALHLLNRTLSRAQTLAAELGPDIGAAINAHPLEDFASLAPRAALVVNTSAMGMHGDDTPVLDLAGLRRNALVTDIVYSPLVTPLLAAAQARGLATVDGLGMLLHQAVPGFARWFGIVPEVTPQLRRLVEESL